jgi:hypothetical protein
MKITIFDYSHAGTVEVETVNPKDQKWNVNVPVKTMQRPTHKEHKISSCWPTTDQQEMLLAGCRTEAQAP